MFRLKACPRCRGDLYLDRDAFGYYWTCLQCARHFDVHQVVGVPPAAPRRTA